MAQTVNMSSSVRITEKGLTLIGKCISGREMHFTKVMLGEGDMPAGTTMDTMTAMVKPMMNLPIQGSYIDAPGVMVLEVALKNAGLATTFQSKEVGVFAQDPNEGEILYAYSYNPKAEFIPAAGGDQLWDMVYEYTTIVKDVPNITVNITDGSGNYATKIDFRKHIEDKNIHLHIGPSVTTCDSVFVQQAGKPDNEINPMAMDVLGKKLLGGDGADITVMKGQISEISREQANMALLLEAKNLSPNYNAMLAEDFQVPDQVDMSVFPVTASAAGDDSIDLASLKGIIPGGDYDISDGVNREQIKVRSVVKNGTTLRVIATAPLANTYMSGKTYLYRSTVQIITDPGEAVGAGDQRVKTWAPNISFTGVTGNVPQTVTVETSLADPSVTMTRDGTSTVDGFFTLK